MARQVEEIQARPRAVELLKLAPAREAMGYLHPGYAASLAQFGTPRELPRSGGWILERPIPGADARDAMGCYPVFTCRQWEELPADLVELSERLVTLVLVTDPFTPTDKAFLDNCFQVVKPFKRHTIVDLALPLTESVSKHHRYYARRSRRTLDCELCEEPSRYAREWIGLYDHLIETRGIRGLRAFSPASFHEQLRVPGMVLVLGRQGDQIVGAHLIAVQGAVAYSHLAAFSKLGYQIKASYGIYWATLEYLAARGVGHLDLGAAAGLQDRPMDGLSQFKRGWSKRTRLVYLCGRVFDPPRYAEICQRRDDSDTEYFPRYRAGEFS